MAGIPRTEDAIKGLLAWLTGGTKKTIPTASAAPTLFACTTCGRTDLPEAGDWDPPICLECDAAINFDALEEQEWHDQQDDLF